MKFIHINENKPSKEYCRCKIITIKGNLIEVDFYAEIGVFIDDDDNEYGWIDNEEDPELVTYWKELEEPRNQDFISTDSRTAINSHDILFTVNEVVGHMDTGAETITIKSFYCSTLQNKVLTSTSNGITYIDYLIKLT